MFYLRSTNISDDKEIPSNTAISIIINNEGKNEILNLLPTVDTKTRKYKVCSTMVSMMRIITQDFQMFLR